MGRIENFGVLRSVGYNLVDWEQQIIMLKPGVNWLRNSGDINV